MFNYIVMQYELMEAITFTMPDDGGFLDIWDEPMRNDYASVQMAKVRKNARHRLSECWDVYNSDVILTQFW